MEWIAFLYLIAGVFIAFLTFMGEEPLSLWKNIVLVILAPLAIGLALLVWCISIALGLVALSYEKMRLAVR
ncbi:MAG: hypothetical protein Q7S63_00115 [bacterium]|nr:hypothetical protein [bacterium]